MEVRTEVDVRYIPIKISDEAIYYLESSWLLGKDFAGVIRVKNTKWSKVLFSGYLLDFDRAKNILEGIKKYSTESGVVYKLAQVKITKKIESEIYKGET